MQHYLNFLRWFTDISNWFICVGLLCLYRSLWRIAFNKYSNLHEAPKRPQSMKISTDIYATLRILVCRPVSTISKTYTALPHRHKQINSYIYFGCCRQCAIINKERHTQREDVKKSAWEAYNGCRIKGHLYPLRSSFIVHFIVWTGALSYRMHVCVCLCAASACKIRSIKMATWLWLAVWLDFERRNNTHTLTGQFA